MRLNIDALQELYNTLTYGPVLSSPYEESPIDRAFKECDEKLSGSATFKVIKDIQNRCDNLERSNKALRDDNDKLSDKAIELAKKNEQLEKDLDANDKENSTLVSANADLSDRNAKLQRNFDRINSLWTGQIQENMELRSKIANLQREKKNYETIAKERADLLNERDGWRRRAEESEKRFGELLLKKYDQSFEDLKKDLDDAKKQLNYFTHSRDDWRARAKHAEEVVDNMRAELEAKVKRMDEITKERDSYHDHYDRLFEENRSLKEKVVDLKKRITELQKKGDDLTKKGEDLQQENEELEKSRKHLRRLYVGEGARHLWEMLQNVNDSQPFEFDVECESMEDVIGMDLDDFLDAYKKWQEEKEQNETDRMRDWLADFCYGRVCKGCPLESNEYKCGCGLSFKKTNESDTCIIPDEDIKRYYEKARGCGQYTLKDAKLFATTVEGVNRAISKACEEFRKAVLDAADNKITENLRKGCTLEAKVEVNKDLLEKVCGVKPNEEEKELDYGDAVRVPWRDYDYMYIGPEGEHIRLFDPKTHTVVVVSVRDNLTYQGCKIILCDEDDIRKIWKDKK